MQRTGSREGAGLPRTLCLALLGALTAAGALAPATARAQRGGTDAAFTQEVDRAEVGTEDTFRLTVTAVNPPAGAQVQFPPAEDFEVLSTSRSEHASIALSGGGPATLQRVRKHVLLLRALKPGTLTIPPATLVTPEGTLRTQAVKVRVRPGSVDRGGAGAASAPPARAADPFEDAPFPDVDVPRGDSDLFLRATLDRDRVYVGEQVTLSLYIFSRVDLSSVDAVTMPKLEGFWSEDVENPTQLTGEQRMVGGVPYRAYLLRRRALFPVRAGTLDIQPAEADITTGFLFAGHRVHRKSNALRVEARPLPPGGPKDVTASRVGQWRLSAEASTTRVELGQPVTVKVTLEGVGNVKNVSPPRLTAPPQLRVYDPTVADRVSAGRGRVSGSRTHEYLVMPQATGTFTLPPLVFAYFDPRAGRYAEARTEPLTVTVEPGAGGTLAQGAPGGQGAADDGARNVLTAGGLRPLRHEANFRGPTRAPWHHPLFLPLLVGPFALAAGVGLLGAARRRVQDAQQSAGQVAQRRTREARRRLAAAEALARGGDAASFYAEVERALLSFLEARAGGQVPLGGLTRDALEARLADAGAPALVRTRARAVLEACEAGRYAPGAERPGARAGVLDAAGEVMEGWR